MVKRSTKKHVVARAKQIKRKVKREVKQANGKKLKKGIKKGIKAYSRFAVNLAEHVAGERELKYDPFGIIPKKKK